MLSVVTWLWKPKPGYRSQFCAEHVNVLRRAVAKHYGKPHRFICVTDTPEGFDRQVEILPLWGDHATIPNPSGAGNPSCYRRLRMFSPEIEALFGPRFVSMDIDAVVTGDLGPLWDRPEDFVIWGDTAVGTPYNGSMVLMTAGARPQVWTDFDPVNSPKITKAMGYVGSDQAWIAAALGPNEPKWTRRDGIFSFRNEIRRDGKLPADARLVMFHGALDPWSPEVQGAYSWVRDHWSSLAVGDAVMPSVIFIKDFDWTDPRKPGVTIAYKAGHRGPVTVPCAVAAVTKGRARRATANDLESVA